jgi:uncharacterized protein (UPF0276 family)
MTQQHLITPPPELVKQWMDAPHGLGFGCHPARSVPDETYAKRLIEAAQWGAGQELGACCEWLMLNGYGTAITRLRAARRSKPLSLKGQALALINHDPANQPFLSDRGIDIIRRALEALPDD